MEHSERIRRVLKKASIKRHLQGGDAAAHGGGAVHEWDAVEWRNPLSELMEAEERALRNAGANAEEMFDVEELPVAFRRGIKELVFDQFRQFESSLIAWIFDAGPHPIEVVRRLFAYTKYRRADLLQNLAFRALGDLLNERGATMAARCKALFGELPAGWKKTEQARESMRVAQQGNCNRRGGKKVGKNHQKTKHKKPTKK